MNYTIDRKILTYTDVAAVGYSVATDWVGATGTVQVGDARWFYGNYYKEGGGMRFRNITIPSDATNISAKLYLCGGANIATHVNSKITLQNSNNAQNFYSPRYDDYFNYINRPRITTSIDWNNISTWTHYLPMESPEIGTLFDELLANFGELKEADIVVFWGDEDGNTPVPPINTSNYIQLGWTSSSLHIEFESAVVLPLPKERQVFGITDADLTNLKWEDSDAEVFNDLRVLVPHAWWELDSSKSPPVLVPVDYVSVVTDAVSQNKYGRRTKFSRHNYIREAITDSLVQSGLSRYREPVPTLKALIIGADDEKIVKCLGTRISDVYSVESDITGINTDFFVDGYTLTLKTNSRLISLETSLSRFREHEVTNIFRVDADLLDSEAVIG